MSHFGDKMTSIDILVALGILTIIGFAGWALYDTSEEVLKKQCTPKTRIMKRPYDAYIEYRMQVYVCEKYMCGEKGLDHCTSCGWKTTFKTQDEEEAICTK